MKEASALICALQSVGLCTKIEKSKVNAFCDKLHGIIRVEGQIT